MVLPEPAPPTITTNSPLRTLRSTSLRIGCGACRYRNSVMEASSANRPAEAAIVEAITEEVTGLKQHLAMMEQRPPIGRLCPEPWTHGSAKAPNQLLCWLGAPWQSQNMPHARPRACGQGFLGRSPGLWLTASPRLPTLRQWHSTGSLPTYSGGPAPDSHRLPYSPRTLPASGSRTGHPGPILVSTTILNYRMILVK